MSQKTCAAAKVAHRRLARLVPRVYYCYRSLEDEGAVCPLGDDMIHISSEHAPRNKVFSSWCPGKPDAVATVGIVRQQLSRWNTGVSKRILGRRLHRRRGLANQSGKEV